MAHRLREAFLSFDRTLEENTTRSAYSMVTLGVIATVLHCIYGVLWLYVAPLEHETVWLRLAGALSGFCLLINKRWPAPLKMAKLYPPGGACQIVSRPIPARPISDPSCGFPLTGSQIRSTIHQDGAMESLPRI